MTKFKLTSHKSTDRLPASIQVSDAKMDLVCIIFVDRRLAPQAQAEDFSIKELKYFISIAKKFDTYFEILEETAQAQEQIKEQEALISQLELENEMYAKIKLEIVR